jgi:serine/threonine protein phosphatase PrpC
MSPLGFRSAGLSHVGRVRALNEDAWLARPELGLWAVADGMGGHARGDLASRTVVDALARVPPPLDAPGFLRAVENALAGAHAALRHVAADTGELCGSTVVALLAFGGHCAFVWAGDSRIYRLRGGRLQRLTRDHSVVEELVERGLITAGEARVHPFRNQITRAVGIDGELDLQRGQGDLAGDDLYLLCSDGLTAHLDDAAIAEVLSSGAPETAARGLVDLTLAAGASDNVTVVVVRLENDAETTWPGR